MSFLDAITNTRALTAKDPALKAMLESWGGAETVSGAHITPHTALRISPWYACVRILSETIASLPFLTYRRLQPLGRERAPEHPVYQLLHGRPNPFMDSMPFIEALQANALGWGNGFAEIEWSNAGHPVALWPIPPDHVRIQIQGQRLWYYVTPPGVGGAEIQLRQEQMFHLRGLGGDGIIGWGVVDIMRESLGLAKVEEEYRARFFKNDARPGGIIEYPMPMSDETFKRYKADWQEVYGGLGNKFRLGFLEQGAKYHDTSFTPEAAQFIEGRKFQKEDIAMITGVPLILLQGTDKATSWGTGIEQFMLAFVQFTIRPWLKRWEGRFNSSLFTDVEQRTFYVEALIDELLRADSLTRAQVLQIWRRNGIINTNEWRQLENLNALPGTQGETYIVEGNMTRLDKVGEDPEVEPATPTEPAEPRRLNGAAH